MWPPHIYSGGLPFACVTFSYVIVEVWTNGEAAITTGTSTFKRFDSCQFQIEWKLWWEPEVDIAGVRYLCGIANADTNDSIVCTLCRRCHTNMAVNCSTPSPIHWPFVSWCEIRPNAELIRPLSWTFRHIFRTETHCERPVDCIARGNGLQCICNVFKLKLFRLIVPLPPCNPLHPHLCSNNFSSDSNLFKHSWHTNCVFKLIFFSRSYTRDGHSDWRCCKIAINVELLILHQVHWKPTAESWLDSCSSKSISLSYRKSQNSHWSIVSSTIATKRSVSGSVS